MFWKKYFGNPIMRKTFFRKYLYFIERWIFAQYHKFSKELTIFAHAGISKKLFCGGCRYDKWSFKWVSLAQTASWGSEIWPWYFILWIHKMLMDHTKPTEKSVCHSGAFSTLCSCCSAIRQLWWVLGGRHGPYLKWL